ncbi:NAD(P)-binding protein [Ceraceosorus guamensis]|uniref:NAD(P)-binding protein n=1 Tax=Ceraceosorus guamensis TaxID=1522189 RepID=A0A316VZQ2_9BASI|nr:NAD(P)-binding protein [Ceraceosorus guamensis]PWN43147.1 NAD(P)-binding protein [Ceraceosorus guamensis]
MTSAPTLPIRVGIIGAGEVSQVVHLPTLQLLPHLYKVTAITDLSLAASKHASSKFGVPQACATVDELVKLQNVDLVLIASADEYHGDHAVAAINAGKHVFIEKPLCLTRQDAERIQDAEQKAGVQVNVAYMRRYAPAFEIFKQLVAESGPVQYGEGGTLPVMSWPMQSRHSLICQRIRPHAAVVRDLIGPNEFFVAQSGTSPIKFVEDIPAGAANDKKAKAEEQHQAFLGTKTASSAHLVGAYRWLASVGSHSLSLMRETFGGLPDRCDAAHTTEKGDFITAAFRYKNKGQGGGFAVSFETGLHGVGVFDSFIEVFTPKRIIKLQYDTPFVKGLPITIIIREADPAIPGSYQERVIRPTFVDAYTSEWTVLAEALEQDKPLKTTVAVSASVRGRACYPDLGECSSLTCLCSAIHSIRAGRRA